MEALYIREAQPSSLTRGEREFACAYLTFTKKLLLDSVAGLSKEAMDARTGPDRWNMTENIGHLALAGDITWKILHEQLGKRTPGGKGTTGGVELVHRRDTAIRKELMPGKGELMRMSVKRIICVMSDRSKKRSSLSGMMPAGRFADCEEALRHFVEQRDRLIDYVRHTGDGLKDGHAFHPFVGMVDLYQFLLLEGAHTARHVGQIEEVKSEFGLYDSSFGKF